MIFAYNGVRNLPYLDKIVLRSTANNPWLMLVPAEVGKMVSMASMHEKSE